MSLLFPDLLNSVRLIWANSRFYNTKDRLTGLLRNISNEIIKRCSAKISLDDIFHGDVSLASTIVQDSINCGEGWKSVYKSTRAHVLKFTNRVWDFDQSSIFAQIGKNGLIIDAFVSRCRDLLEICQNQVQFSRKIGSQKAPIPCFGGMRGPEVSKT
jgi:dynein heavy chain